jgi:NADH dehydrogenase
MASCGARTIVVFGGTGFLGRRVVRRLRDGGSSVRIATRHPRRSDDAGVQPVEANVHDERSVANALAGAYAAINAVSLYVEHGRETFEAVHVDAARRLAACARRAGLARLAHLSGIGSDPASPSLYIRKRAEGERAVREAFADVLIVRPAVMFGPDDAFLTVILELLRRLPVYPLFGRGLTRLQPASVDDVAAAIVNAVQRPEPPPATIECGGPRVFTYRQLVETIAREAGLTPRLMEMPFAVWHAVAWGAAMLPSPPITRSQIELMQVDTIQSPTLPGLRELGISPHSLEDMLRRMLGRPSP